MEDICKPFTVPLLVYVEHDSIIVYCNSVQIPLSHLDLVT